MSFNQELTEQRMLSVVTLRRLGLMVFLAAAVLLFGCASAPEEQQVSAAPAAPAAGTQSAPASADDLTATEAAIAAMNEPAAAGTIPRRPVCMDEKGSGRAVDLRELALRAVAHEVARQDGFGENRFDAEALQRAAFRARRGR